MAHFDKGEINPLFGTWAWLGQFVTYKSPLRHHKGFGPLTVCLIVKCSLHKKQWLFVLPGCNVVCEGSHSSRWSWAELEQVDFGQLALTQAVIVFSSPDHAAFAVSLSLPVVPQANGFAIQEGLAHAAGERCRSYRIGFLEDRGKHTWWV